ncbi:M23 family metallopeptidase [Vampirovibrio chlorellavorus]|uniref:M23 family metallopeptidase n=1 Tax=Vampirovibrio chlorellavorus TaxID=758823 RepID=UPI0026EC0AEE|nr:M23 family metallopeptidase [Vampirovibrio chlorellavorus]
MPLSAQTKPSPVENPFSQVKPSVFVRQSTKTRGPQGQGEPLVCGGQAGHGGITRRRPGFLTAAVTTLATRGLIALMLFALLPLPWQQTVFQTLGLGRFHPSLQTVRVPLPVDYSHISSPYGQRWGRPHQGIDLAARAGLPIFAISDGTVTHSGWESGYGYSVVLDHGGDLQTRYAHCSQLLVPVGSRVMKGQPIAKVGSSGHSTGPHLHFEVLVKGLRKNPAWYYPFKESPQRYWLTVRKKIE